MTRKLTLPLGVLTACLLLAGPARAGGFDLQEQGYYIVDLLILVVLAATFVKGPAKAFLETRYETARREMNESMAVKTEAEARLARYEAALANLDTEVTELNDAFRLDGERETERITASGEESADKIRRDSAETLARESAQLKADFERTVAVQALERAETLIRSRLNATHHKALIQSLVTELESREEIGSFTG